MFYKCVRFIKCLEPLEATVSPRTTESLSVEGVLGIPGSRDRYFVQSGGGQLRLGPI